MGALATILLIVIGLLGLDVAVRGDESFVKKQLVKSKDNKKKGANTNG